MKLFQLPLYKSVQPLVGILQSKGHTEHNA